MKMLLFILLTSLAAGISGCGMEEKIPSSLTRLPTVVAATIEDVKNHFVVKDSYLVAFKSDFSGERMRFSTYLNEYKAHYGFLLDKYFFDPGIADIHFISSVDLSDPSAHFQDPKIDAPRQLQLAWQANPKGIQIASIARVDFKSHKAAKRLLLEWTIHNRIWFADPNYRSELSEMGDWAVYESIYKDFGGWHDSIKLSQAFRHLEGISGATDDEPIIAVLDSGLVPKHSGFINANGNTRIWQNNETGTRGCGSDDHHGCNTTAPQKGLLGDGNIEPFNLDSSGACPTDKSGSCRRDCCHGSHVSGLIAGVPSADVATSPVGGVCPTCRILTIRAVAPPTAVGGGGLFADGAAKDGTIVDSAIAGGLKYISQVKGSSRVRVLNASFGKFQRNRAISVLVRAIRDIPGKNKGTIIIGAAGNEDTDRPQYPAAYPDAIAVANINNEGIKASSSSFGRWVDIAAPGTGLYSAVPGDTYEPKRGTSMSSPVVAGAVGLMLATDSNLSIDIIRDRLLSGADGSIYGQGINTSYLVRIPGVTAPVPLLGTGKLNVFNAVSNTPTDNRPAIISLDRVGSSCASLGGLTADSSHLFWLNLLLLIPALGPLCRRRRKNLNV